jgi:2-oxoglutarate dehydrogenase E2 component (dihydrolipoamide succinyltransferase)
MIKLQALEKVAVYNYELILPAMGEGIIEATITKWLVSKGQQISVDQPLVEIATDKVDSEIPSPVEGTISRLIYREGEIPKVGEVIAIIETSARDAGFQGASLPPSKANNSGSETGNTRTVAQTLLKDDPGDKVLTPLVRMLAKQLGLGAEELKSIKGTGENGRVTRDDMHNYIIHDRRFSENGQNPVKVNGSGAALRSDIVIGANDEVKEMDRMRKIIAAHMIASKRTAPHVTSFLEADVTALVRWREERKTEFLKEENARLTFTPVFVEAVAIALKKFPRINVMVNGDTIVTKKNINIGVATALADGNLIVPVIRNADYENLGSLARKIADLANRARNGALHPEEIKNGTFTITNIGQYNNLTGTPIINQPESAILAFGTILKKPWAVKTIEGYGIAVRDIIMLSLTYDHRVIDGALGGSFLSAVAENLEKFDITR